MSASVNYVTNPGVFDNSSASRDARRFSVELIADGLIRHPLTEGPYRSFLPRNRGGAEQSSDLDNRDAIAIHAVHMRPDRATTRGTQTTAPNH